MSGKQTFSWLPNEPFVMLMAMASRCLISVAVKSIWQLHCVTCANPWVDTTCKSEKEQQQQQQTGP